MNKALRFARRSAALLLCLALLAGGALASTVRGDLSDRFEEPPTLEKDGQTYQYRRGLTTILLMGIDTRLEYDDVREGFRNGGQSDFLLLLVIDERNETVTPIHINRDVMTEITILGVLGESIGTIETQLCLSHGFGDGKEESCEYTCDAVRNLLLGVDIDYYISMNLDGISELNDLMGGVTVTLNEDLTAFDPTMTAGTTMTLHGMQAEYFVRQRYYIGDGSNMGRMERQRQYMAEFAKLAYARLEESADFIGELFDQLKPMLVTNMARGAMINTAWGARDYALAQTRTLEGENVVGPDDHMEFYADEEALRDMVIELFYEPVE